MPLSLALWFLQEEKDPPAHHGDLILRKTTNQAFLSLTAQEEEEQKDYTCFPCDYLWAHNCPLSHTPQSHGVGICGSLQCEVEKPKARRQKVECL